MQEVERQHEALQEAGNAHSQREGQRLRVQAEVSRLQVRWISDGVDYRLLGAASTFLGLSAFSDPHVVLTAADFVPASLATAAWMGSLPLRISCMAVAGSCLAPLTVTAAALAGRFR